MFVAQQCPVYNATREEENLKRRKLQEKEEKVIESRKQQNHQLQESFGTKRSIRASRISLKLDLSATANKDEIKDTVKGWYCFTNILNALLFD